MAKPTSRTTFSGLSVAAVFASVLGLVAPAEAQEQQPAVECSVDLALAGQMKDIVSNALMHGLNRPEPRVAAFLVDAEKRYAGGPELLRAAAQHFEVGEAVLAAEVEKFKHCNCGHPPAVADNAGPGAGERKSVAIAVSAFAKDVTLHVVLHELGHALVREFDIPILGNEETVADAFATYYLTTYMPDRAVAVLTARTMSLMIEAGEKKGVDWSGEHDHDARRAYQIAALAVAADPQKYGPVAKVVGMAEDDIRSAQDYGAEIRRSWRRVLAPLWMPEGAASNEARVIYDSGNASISSLCSDGLASEVEAAVRCFDWHSLVTIRFVDGDGGAGWNRSGRSVTVHIGYVRRFIEQGERGLRAPK